MPISWINTYSFLSYFSIFGIAMATIGMLMMFGYLGKKISTDNQVEGSLKVFDVK